MKAAETNILHKALESGVGNRCSGGQEVTSFGLKVNFKDSTWNVAHSAGRTRYSDDLADRRQGNDSKMYKLFVNLKMIEVQNTSGPYLRQK